MKNFFYPTPVVQLSFIFFNVVLAVVIMLWPEIHVQVLSRLTLSYLLLNPSLTFYYLGSAVFLLIDLLFTYLLACLVNVLLSGDDARQKKSNKLRPN